VTLAIYTREYQSGDSAPSRESDNGVYGVVHGFSRTGGTEWDIAIAFGKDENGDGDVDMTATADPGGAAGDMLVVLHGSNNNVSGLTRSSLTFTWTGATLGSSTEQFADDASSGDDGTLFTDTMTVSSGTSSAAPNTNYGLTEDSAESAMAVAFLRLREGGSGEITPSGIASAEAFGTALVFDPDQTAINLLEDGSASGSTSVATASIDPADDWPIYVIVATNNGTTAELPTGITGNGLTWTEVAEHNRSGVSVTIYEGHGTPSAGAVTISYASAPDEVAWAIIQATNVDHTTESNGIVQIKELDFGSVTDGGGTFDATVDSANPVIYTVAVSPDSAFTPDAGYTEIVDLTGPSQLSLHVSYDLTGTDSFGATFDFSQYVAVIALELNHGTLAIPVNPTGIASGEAFGSPTLTTGEVTVSPSGIASAEAFGTAKVNQQIRHTSIASAESVSSPVVSQGAAVIQASGIASTEAFGNATLTTGSVDVSPTGVATAEAFGTPTLELTVEPTGIGTAEAFGTAALTPGAVTVAPDAIDSGEAFGTAEVTREASEIYPPWIPSLEAFGTPSIVWDQVVTAEGIASREAFGPETTLRRKVFVLDPPTIVEHRRPRSDTTTRVGNTVAQTVYKLAGVWRTGTNLRADIAEAAEILYRGGYQNVVDDEDLRAELIAEGFSFTQQEET
jgi:hypothetical protein